MDYNNIQYLEYETNCTAITISKWDKLMEGAKRANVREINRLVKLHLPELYDSLCLWAYNPYNYYRTDKHLILVHSNIEYFLRYV